MKKNSLRMVGVKVNNRQNSICVKIQEAPGFIILWLNTQITLFVKTNMTLFLKCFLNRAIKKSLI